MDCLPTDLKAIIEKDITGMYYKDLMDEYNDHLFALGDYEKNNIIIFTKAHNINTRIKNNNIIKRETENMSLEEKLKYYRERILDKI